jgi:lipoprotein-releasing system ATP-binding protein
MSNPIVQLSHVHKVYEKGGHRLEVLKGIDLEVYPGESLSIVGASGSGKSTLLHIMGALDAPTSGQVSFKGSSLNGKSDEELALLRNQEIGFVFQFHHLLPEFTALENVMLPCRIGQKDMKQAKIKAEELLRQVGLTDRQHHFPSEMSGGEQQRVAIARALVQSPRLLLADEPTGNLDTQNSRVIEELFMQFQRNLGLTLLVVTHDNHFAARFPRRLMLKDGQWN